MGRRHIGIRKGSCGTPPPQPGRRSIPSVETKHPEPGRPIGYTLVVGTRDLVGAGAAVTTCATEWIEAKR